MDQLLKINMPISKFLLFTVLTIGIYPLVWLAANLDALNTFIQGRKIQLKDIAVVGALFVWPFVLDGVVMTQPEEILTIFKICRSIASIVMYCYLYIYITKPFMDSLVPALTEAKIEIKRKELRSFILSYLYMLSMINQLNRAHAQPK
jgi:hypothetical protein